MINKRNKFWTFLFSLIPGAGEMYMGFFRHGGSIMGLFFLIAAIAVTLNLGQLALLLPILWFYSFFHTHCLKNMPEEEFYALEDAPLLPLPDGFFDSDLRRLLSGYRRPLAAVFVVFGAALLWQNAVDLLAMLLPNYLSDLLYSIGWHLPQIAVGLLLLFIGFRLITAKKKELDEASPTEEIFPALPAPRDDDSEV